MFHTHAFVTERSIARGPWPRRWSAGYALGVALLLGGPLGAADAWAQFSLVSVAQGGGAANGASRDAAIDATGRFVAFTSEATNLVPNDNNASADVFVRDRQANVTTRVSVTSGGAEASGQSETAGITPDGRFVVFSSYAALVAGDTNSCASPAGVPTCGDVYVHDRQANTTSRISVSSQGAQGDNHSSTPSISADGRYVVFASEATNLVLDDTNNQSDVFLHDRQTNTTTRISRTPSGLQMPLGASRPIISADGELIVYSGFASPQDVLDPETCDPATSMCQALYETPRATGISAILSNAFPVSGFVPGAFRMTLLRASAISADGRFVLIDQGGILIHSLGVKGTRSRSIVHDRLMNRTTAPFYTAIWPLRADRILGMSSDGRTFFHLVNAPPVPSEAVYRWSDRISGISSVVSNPEAKEQFAPMAVSLSLGARFAAFTTASALTTGDDNLVTDIFVHDRDTDGDGMPGAWETTFGLNPELADPSADADSDGIVNLDEYLRGSHPAASHTRYFAEGAANAFFSTRFAVLNPGDTATAVVLRYLGQQGQEASDVVTLPAKSRRTVSIAADRLGADNDFSTVVESSQPVIADRTMFWGFGATEGAHAETSLPAPSTTWHLAEGATHGAFDLFYLFQNPNPSKATVTVNYLRLDPATPVVKTYEVPANSRRTIWVDDEGPELSAVDVGAAISSDLPIVVERAMYSTRPGQTAFAAGHGGAGVTAPAPKWFLAEGATGQFFDLYVLIANPNAAVSDVKVTYLLGDGGDSFSKTYSVGPQTRKTLFIRDEDPRLVATSVSMIVETTNNQPLVVERAMWWPRDQWYEAHLSAGATATGTRWALAEGDVTPGSVRRPRRARPP
jgi:hypothetical protein